MKYVQVAILKCRISARHIYIQNNVQRIHRRQLQADRWLSHLHGTYFMGHHQPQKNHTAAGAASRKGDDFNRFQVKISAPRRTYPVAGLMNMSITPRLHACGHE